MKRRGELGLVKLNLSWEDAQKWMKEQAFKELSVQGVVDEVHGGVVWGAMQCCV